MIWILVRKYFSQEGKSHSWCRGKEFVPVALFETGGYSTTLVISKLASPRSILVLSGRYHIISNASLVNNCIIMPFNIYLILFLGD